MILKANSVRQLSKTFVYINNDRNYEVCLVARLPSQIVPDQYMLVSYGPVRTEDFFLTVETYCIFCIVCILFSSNRSEDPVTGLITKYKNNMYK